MKRLIVVVALILVATSLQAELIPEEFRSIIAEARKIRYSGSTKMDPLDILWPKIVPEFTFAPTKWKLIVDGVEGNFYPYSGHQPFMIVSQNGHKGIGPFLITTIWITYALNWVDHGQFNFYNVTIIEPTDPKLKQAYKDKNYVRFTALCSRPDSISLECELDLIKVGFSVATISITKKIGDSKATLVLWGRVFTDIVMDQTLNTTRSTR